MRAAWVRHPPQVGPTVQQAPNCPKTLWDARVFGERCAASRSIPFSFSTGVSKLYGSAVVGFDEIREALDAWDIRTVPQCQVSHCSTSTTVYLGGFNEG